jgi:hypothetical protein
MGRAGGTSTRRPSPKRWAKKLTRRIMVTKGPHDWLLTLDDARTYIFRHLAGAKPTKDLDRAVELLVEAAATGKLKDREAATSHFECLLKARNWL